MVVFCHLLHNPGWPLSWISPYPVVPLSRAEHPEEKKKTILSSSEEESYVSHP